MIKVVNALRVPYCIAFLRGQSRPAIYYININVNIPNWKI